MGRQKARRTKRSRPATSPREVPRLPVEQRVSTAGEAFQAGTLPPPAKAVVEDLLRRYLAISRADPDAPACGGPLVIHADGNFACFADCPGAKEVLHLPEALQLCTEAYRYDIDPTDMESCEWCEEEWFAADNATVGCPGVEIMHDDGETTCSRGDDCLDEGFHAEGQTCGLLEPCDRCGKPAAFDRAARVNDSAG
jgi:hypothetical protein